MGVKGWREEINHKIKMWHFFLCTNAIDKERLSTKTGGRGLRDIQWRRKICHVGKLSTYVAFMLSVHDEQVIPSTSRTTKM